MSHGGNRDGAGGPTRDSVRVRFSVLNCTRVTLERVARERKYFIGKIPDIGKVIDDMAKGITTKEPEYLRLARECHLNGNGATPSRG